MACESCAKRREAIAKIAKALGGTIVFGRKRVLTAPQPEPTDNGKR